jgi:hypothetical protein
MAIETQPAVLLENVHLSLGRGASRWPFGLGQINAADGFGGFGAGR